MRLRSSVNALLLAVLAITQSSAIDALAARVSIYRDGYGVPHIVGDSEQATFYGYGYAQAQDHLEAMMLQYRDAQGRLSEVKGRSVIGEGEVRFNPREFRWGGDYLQRLLRTWQCVVDNKEKMDPTVSGLLDAFARGVNSYIEEHRASVPAWIDGVSATDIEALERSNYMRYYSSADGLEELKPERERPLTFGSNHAAISKEKSANGRILHAASVHMPWANRFQLYEAHLITPGKLNAGGVGWFGSPFFLSGFNDKITWSVTYNRPHISDIYEEKLSARHPLQYLYEGAWHDMRVERPTFRFLEGGVQRVETRKLYYTHHGPIIEFDRRNRRAYALKLPNFEGVNYSLGLYLLMKSRDLATFQGALSKQLIPRWNFLYTDAANLYWVHNGIVAIRGGKFDSRKPLPGWRRDTEWGPYLPFSANPQIANPKSGFLQNCNNPPWVATRESGLKPLDPTPYYLSNRPKASDGEEVLNPRGERMFEILTRPQGRFTVNEFLDLNYDTYVLAADVFVPMLLEAAQRRQPLWNTRLSHAIELLRGWDRRSGTGSTAYTYVHYFAKAYSDLFWTSLFQRFSRFDRKRIDVHSRVEQTVAWWAFKLAVKRMEERYGKRDVTWGEVNGVMRGTWIPVDGTGDFDVLHPDTGAIQGDGRVYCNDGWGHMMVAVEGEKKQIWTLLPFGESENRLSKHYADQARLHSRGRLKRFWFTPTEILANAESVWGDRERIKRTMCALGKRP